MDLNYSLSEIRTIINKQLIGIQYEDKAYKKLSKFCVVYSFPITEYLGDLMLVLEEIIIDNTIVILDDTFDLYYSLCISFNRKACSIYNNRGSISKKNNNV